MIREPGDLPISGLLPSRRKEGQPSEDDGKVLGVRDNYAGDFYFSPIT